ncbi:hypothetical protein PSHT_16237, partial [Puccinia striiformis]
MSRRVYDLLARENPLAGYHLAAESWRIHWLGSEPADLPPQIIQCTAKFKLLFPKKGSPDGMMAKERENNRKGTGDIVCDAVASGSPRMDCEAGFLAWINMIVELGDDTTNSCLELEKHVDGVSYYSPPASIKFVKISDAKRQPLDHERLRHGNSPSSESDPPALIEPNEDLLRKYIELVIKPEKQEKVMKILVDHDIAHPNSF